MDQATLFVAECLWPDVTRCDVDALDRRVALDARANVEHVGTTLVPTDDVVFVWFSAPSEACVRETCLRASVPFDRVVAAEGWPQATFPPPKPKENP